MGIAIGKPRRRDPRSAEPDQRTPPDGALPVVRPRARRRHDVRAAPVWLLLLPGGGRGQGGAPDWTNDLDAGEDRRSEEHTSELQSQFHLVCRLLLEKKKKMVR